MNLVLVLLGVLLLYWGGETLIKHAVRLARSLGVRPLVVGLTVVAFGTSCPELAASLVAASRGRAEIALGNVIGSNIANLGLILGLTALLLPIRAEARFIRREIPFMLLVSTLLPVFLQSGRLDRYEGLVLTALLIPYLYLLLRGGEQLQVEEQFSKEYGEVRVSPGRAGLGVAAGILVLVLGAYLMVEGAVGLARAIGISERVIGLTLVAFGTSLPELATSIVAAMKRESDIVLGNLIGSNIFNILGVLGIVGLVRPISVDNAALWIDCGVMLGVSALILPFFVTRHRLGRVEGAILLSSYLAYVFYLFLA